MKIFENLQRVAAAVALDDLSGGTFGERVKNAGIDAVMGGINSEAWKKYMSLFADNAEQLKLLTTPDPENDPSYLPQSRAYIVTNSICGTITGTRTHLNVDRDIDENLSTDDDGTVVRPFSIPEI
ncbi:MAG TPA: hypothetical protein VFX96_12375 [Pyrinomonadaceae bacterium]|nr:hypothetical protein [Pyrinomonadaceae bacterium]